MRQTAFIVAVVVLASVLLASFMFGAPRPTPKADKLTTLPAIVKADRIANAFAGMPPPADPLDPIPVRVIPISRQAVVDTPTASALLTRTAMADRSPADNQDRPSGAVSTSEPSEEADSPPPRHSDICAAHGMKKVERGRGWRCVGHARR